MPYVTGVCRYGLLFRIQELCSAAGRHLKFCCVEIFIVTQLLEERLVLVKCQWIWVGEQIDK